jgi:hypothetical protein
MGLFNKQKEKTETAKTANKPKQAAKTSKADEINAAIAAAIYLFTTHSHDYESAVLTIKRIVKIYSPWSSKIYGLRKSPR